MHAEVEVPPAAAPGAGHARARLVEAPGLRDDDVHEPGCVEGFDGAEKEGFPSGLRRHVLQGFEAVVEEGFCGFAEGGLISQGEPENGPRDTADEQVLSRPQQARRPPLDTRPPRMPPVVPPVNQRVALQPRVRPREPRRLHHLVRRQREPHRHLHDHQPHRHAEEDDVPPAPTPQPDRRREKAQDKRPPAAPQHDGHRSPNLPELADVEPDEALVVDGAEHEVGAGLALVGEPVAALGRDVAVFDVGEDGVRGAVVPAYAGLAGEVDEEVIHVLCFLGDVMDVLGERLEVVLVLERVDELGAVALVPQRVAHVVCQRV